MTRYDRPVSYETALFIVAAVGGFFVGIVFALVVSR